MHLASRALELEVLHEALTCAEAARTRRLSKAKYHLESLRIKTTIGERIRERKKIRREVHDWLKEAGYPRQILVTLIDEVYPNWYRISGKKVEAHLIEFALIEFAHKIALIELFEFANLIGNWLSYVMTGIGCFIIL